LGNIIYVKYKSRSLYKVVLCRQLHEGNHTEYKILKEVLAKSVFSEHFRILFNEKRTSDEKYLRFCRRIGREETNRKTYAYMGVYY
jgi:hypothetical protein